MPDDTAAPSRLLVEAAGLCAIALLAASSLFWDLGPRTGQAWSTLEVRLNEQACHAALHSGAGQSRLVETAMFGLACLAMSS